ncbi:hypothetical protein MAR_014019 [Mya arenaria]|uniref:Methyltransferase FkbM domain-containing protein n=2 Tax=Mya arenaria TaxID=6604 RepID=A0ABY7G1H2_MYAAR|nr:uncharacterized protein LOC128219013 [Mya arenaria]WAR28315.1 hypothetical protein MAR_014019 [Mya arenaria]
MATFKMWRHSKYIRSCKYIIRGCIIITIVCVIIELLFINTLILFSLMQVKHLINDFSSSHLSIIATLARYNSFRHIVAQGKDEGFKYLIDNTIARIYMEHESENCGKTISRLGFDVSSAGEFLFILEQMQRQKAEPWKKLVVEIGANDGLLSSNSYNFIQMGWSAILVEPQRDQLDLAKKNHDGLTNQHQDQSVHYVHAVISDHDGQEKLHVSADLFSMQSRIVSEEEQDSNYVEVPSYSVKTFVSKYKVPKHFGVLSIDVEGMEDKIIRQWVEHGFRPIYIILEFVHRTHESQVAITDLLIEKGYTLFGIKGFNFIYEYDTNLIDKDDN